MSDWKQLDEELDQAILTGKALDAFEKFYADDVVMIEGTGEKFEGKDVNRKREQDFFGSVEEFHGASVGAKGYGNHASLAEWVFDLTFKGGNRVKMEQAVVRNWKDNKVVRERFYYHGTH